MKLKTPTLISVPYNFLARIFQETKTAATLSPKKSIQSRFCAYEFCPNKNAQTIEIWE